MHRSALLTALTAPLLAACAVLPPARATSAFGDVEAPDVQTALETAALVNALATQLAGLGEGLVERRVHVQVVPQLGTDADIYGGYHAAGSRIVLSAGRGNAEATLAHELVHAMEPPSWGQLPALVREGLADHYAARAVPEIEHKLRASRALALAGYCGTGIPLVRRLEPGKGRMVLEHVSLKLGPLPSPMEVLAVPHGAVLSLGSGRQLGALYGMGLLIVERAGVTTLVDLARDARAEGLALVPPERILTAASLSSDPGEWLPAIEAWIARPADIEALRARVDELSLRTEPAPLPPRVRD